jgi:DNA modification methylase
MSIKIVDIKTVKPNPSNPRNIKDHKFTQLVKSIRHFPEMLQLRPIVVDSDNIVLGGNMRLKACIEAGLKEVPIIVASELTDEQQKEFIIKDNVGFGEWDWEQLANEWEIEQLSDWGLDLPIEMEDTEIEAVEDNYQAPDTIETDIVIGDLFEIGEHRLLCGDSTDSDAVAKLMDGEKADMAHNDPPYGMKKESEGVLNDNLNFDDLLQFNREWIALQFSHLKDNGSFYCWGIDEPLMDIYSHILKPYIKEQKATFRNLITWNKGNGQGQNAKEFRMYPIADEKCLFVMCGVQGFNNNADNYFEGWDSIVNYLDEQKNKAGFTIKDCKRLAGHSEKSGCHWFDKSQWMMPTKETYNAWKTYCQTNNIDAFKKGYEELKKEYEELKKEWYSTRAYFDNTHDNQNNVWHFDRTSNKERETTGGHATPKPIALCERAIKSSCPDNGLVLDFFLGSGSTMVASHQLKRKCYGIELDPKYCQIIIDRMIKLDPDLKITRNGQPYESVS